MDRFPEIGGYSPEIFELLANSFKRNALDQSGKLRPYEEPVCFCK